MAKPIPASAAGVVADDVAARPDPAAASAALAFSAQPPRLWSARPHLSRPRPPNRRKKACKDWYCGIGTNKNTEPNPWMERHNNHNTDAKRTRPRRGSLGYEPDQARSSASEGYQKKQTVDRRTANDCTPNDTTVRPTTRPPLPPQTRPCPPSSPSPPHSHPAHPSPSARPAPPRQRPQRCRRSRPARGRPSAPSPAG